MMTDEMYNKHDGQLCPFCGSVELSWDSFDTDRNQVTQAVECTNCGEMWSDLYTRVGFIPFIPYVPKEEN